MTEHPSQNPVDRRRLRTLAILSGLLLGASFPPVPIGVTAFVGMLPFLLLLRRMQSAAQTFRYAYLTFLVFNISTIWWVSGWWGRDPWLKAAGVAVNLVHPLLFTIPALALYVLHRQYGWRSMLLLFPPLWAGWEWIAQLPELSFPWLILGNSQAYAPESIQFASYTGVYGVSFWIAAVNAVFAWLVYLLVEEGREQRLRSIRGTAALALALLLVPQLHGRFVVGSASPHPTMRIGIAQPNVDPYEKWSEGETPARKVASLLELYEAVAKDRSVELVLLPETAFPFFLLQPSYESELREVRRRVDSSNVPLLTGFADLQWYDPGEGPASAKRVPDGDFRYDTFNASVLVHPAEKALQVYRKSRLTPLSERIPYLDALPFLQDALSWGVGISSWGLGNDTTSFTLDGRDQDPRLWTMICYETLYPSFVAGFVARGANVLGVITNDGWFGNSSGPYQLQAYAVLRAIETRRAVARCANNGISCFIDAYGRISQETAFNERTWISGDVEIRTDRTVYVRYGDLFAMTCAGLAILALLGALLQPIVFRARRSRNSEA